MHACYSGSMRAPNHELCHAPLNGLQHAERLGRAEETGSPRCGRLPAWVRALSHTRSHGKEYQSVSNCHCAIQVSPYSISTVRVMGLFWMFSEVRPQNCIVISDCYRNGVTFYVDCCTAYMFYRNKQRDDKIKMVTIFASSLP
jgi:hypothetical protein